MMIDELLVHLECCGRYGPPVLQAPMSPILLRRSSRVSLSIATICTECRALHGFVHGLWS